MIRPNVKWQHSSEELKKAYKQELRGEIKIMILALWRISKGSSIADTSRALGYAYNTVHSWLKSYNSCGLPEPEAKERKKQNDRKRRLTNEEIKKIQEMYRSEELPTIDRVREYVAKNYKITYSYCGLYRILKRMKLDEDPES